jgi:hypothetical protein
MILVILTKTFIYFLSRRYDVSIRVVRAWLIDGVLNWMIGFIDALYTQHGTTGSRALSVIYTLYTSQLHTHYDSQSSLVVSWQRIFKSLTVTSNHTWSLLFKPNSFLAIIVSSIQFLCSQAHIPAGWRLDTRLFTSLYAAEHFFVTTLQYHAENTACIVKEACLPIRCLAMDFLLLRVLVPAIV